MNAKNPPPEGEGHDYEKVGEEHGDFGDYDKFRCRKCGWFTYRILTRRPRR